MIIKKTPDQIEKMRVVGGKVAESLREIAARIEPGKTTTLDLDRIADEIVREKGGIPSFLNYRGYPNSVCVAVNEEVVHGIPNNRVLKTGDIVGIDLGIIYDGWHGDSAITVGVGDVSEDASRLMRVARESLMKGIEKALCGNRVSDIGNAIQAWAERHGYSVVRDLVGHGIGRDLHEDPHVPNFGRPGEGPLLEEGMTLAIEPMVNAGAKEVNTLQDRWTIVTRDGKLSAHFEHVVAISADGPDILTLGKAEEAN